MLPSACLLFIVLLALMAPPAVLAQAPYGLQERVPNNALLIAPVRGTSAPDRLRVGSV